MSPQITLFIAMSPLRRLASQTAVYGLSSILGRFLNYLLVPLYTYSFPAREYGVVSEFYAYAGFLSVVLGLGLETAYFRFRSSVGEAVAFKAAFWMLLPLNGLFLGAVLMAQGKIAAALNYPLHPEYVAFFAWILATDAISALPFARLRAEQRALRFAGIKLAEIGVTVGLNLLLVLGPGWLEHQTFMEGVPLRLPVPGIESIFVANLIGSLFKLILLTPEWMRAGRPGSLTACRALLGYGLPMVIVGLAGMVNEMLDRVALKYLLPGDFETNLRQLGIYAACYKLSLLMTLFVQAFRYAGEPFFFAYAGHQDARLIYARVMRYFVIFCGGIYLLVVLFLDIFQYFVGEEYRSGLDVVPILLMANLFLGVYINLSVWYKLIDRTGLGALVSLMGAILTAMLNVWWIPRAGYLGAAWATLVCYGTMAAVSWALGRRYYPIPYPLLRMGIYLLLVLGLGALPSRCMAAFDLSRTTAGFLLIGLYAVGVGVMELWPGAARPDSSPRGRACSEEAND